MKALLPFTSLSIYFLLMFTATGSIRLKWLQTYLFAKDRVVTHFGSLEMEDIQIIYLKNDAKDFRFAEIWPRVNQTDVYWNTFKVFLLKYFSSFRIHIDEINKQLGIDGPITVQCWIGCPSSMDTNTGLTFRVGEDGEELIYLNVAERLWVAGSSRSAQTVQKLMQEATDTMNNIEKHVNDMCKTLTDIFATAGKEVFSRKIRPQVYITRRSSKADTEVICMVTGFYPKSVNVSLWKENTMAEVISTETLPNGDGTYQITVLTSVNVTEQQSFYCRVEHSSLKEALIVYLDKKRHTPYRLVVAVTVTFIVCVVTVMCIVKWYRKRKQDGLRTVQDIQPTACPLQNISPSTK